MTNQLSFVSLGVLVEVFSEPDVTSGVKDEGERMLRCGGNADKRGNVWMGELTAYRNLPAVSLEQTMNHGVHEEQTFSPGKEIRYRRFLGLCKFSG